MYMVVTHIFEGLWKSFPMIFSPLIEEKFHKIAASDYTTAICCVLYSRNVTLPLDNIDTIA